MSPRRSAVATCLVAAFMLALAVGVCALVLGAGCSAAQAARPYAPDTAITNAFYGEGAQYVVEFQARDINSPNYPVEFECRVDRGEWYACTSPQLLSGLDAGRHVFRARTVFRGATDPTPARVRFEL